MAGYCSSTMALVRSLSVTLAAHGLATEAVGPLRMESGMVLTATTVAGEMLFFISMVLEEDELAVGVLANWIWEVVSGAPVSMLSPANILQSKFD